MYGQNPFSGITSGDQAGGARYPFLGGDKGDPLNGDYKLNIHQIVIRGRGKPNYIVEVDILESNQPQRPPGMRCVCFIDITNADTRGKHLCGLISSIYGYDPLTLPKDSAVAPWTELVNGQQVNVAWADYIQWSCSEQNPFANRKVGCNVRTTETAAGNDFSLHTWIPYDKMIIPAAAPITVARPVPQMQQPMQLQGGGFAPPGSAPGFAPAPQQPGFAPQQPQPSFGPPQQPGFAPQQPQPSFGPPQQPGFGPTFGPVPQQPQPGFAPAPQQPQPGFAPASQQPQPGFAPAPQQPQPGFGPPTSAPWTQPPRS
jgi:hypothetical protein